MYYGYISRKIIKYLKKNQKKLFYFSLTKYFITYKIMMFVEIFKMLILGLIIRIVTWRICKLSFNILFTFIKTIQLILILIFCYAFHVNTNIY